MRCNSRSVCHTLRIDCYVNAPYGSTKRMATHTISIHENILSPINEMQYSKRMLLFKDRLLGLRSVRSVRIDTALIRIDTVRVYWTTLQIKNRPKPL